MQKHLESLQLMHYIALLLQKIIASFMECRHIPLLKSTEMWGWQVKKQIGGKKIAGVAFIVVPSVRNLSISLQQSTSKTVSCDIGFQIKTNHLNWNLCSAFEVLCCWKSNQRAIHWKAQNGRHRQNAKFHIILNRIGWVVIMINQGKNSNFRQEKFSVEQLDRPQGMYGDGDEGGRKCTCEVKEKQTSAG